MTLPHLQGSRNHTYIQFHHFSVTTMAHETDTEDLAMIGMDSGDLYKLAVDILGSLLITAMVALFNSQIIPGIQDKITELFDAYSGPVIGNTDPTPYA